MKLSWKSSPDLSLILGIAPVDSDLYLSTDLKYDLITGTISQTGYQEDIWILETELVVI